MKLSLNADGRSKPLFSGDWLVKRAVGDEVTREKIIVLAEIFVQAQKAVVEIAVAKHIQIFRRQAANLCVLTSLMAAMLSSTVEL